MTPARFVLIADDDVDLVRALEYILKGMGWKYRSCLDAADFIVAVKEKRPDLCLVDINLGEIGVGFKLIKAVRNTPGFEDLPIVAISGQTDSKKIAHAIEMGADDYIAKPLRREALVSKLTEIMALRLDGGMDHDPRIVPVSERPCRLEVAIKIVSISEKGITAIASALISKGTVLDLTCPELADIFTDGKVRLTVGSNWKQLDPNLGGTYGMELEYSTSDEAIFDKVRNFITHQKNH